MNKYKVTRKEVYDVTYLVQAKDMQEARELVDDAVGIKIYTEYDTNLEEYGVDCEFRVEEY